MEIISFTEIGCCEKDFLRFNIASLVCCFGSNDSAPKQAESKTISGQCDQTQAGPGGIIPNSPPSHQEIGTSGLYWGAMCMKCGIIPNGDIIWCISV